MRVNFQRMGTAKDRAREIAGVRNPWIRTSKLAPGHETEICDAVSRCEVVKEMPAERLREVVAWPGTQVSVRKAAEARLRKLTL